MKSNIAEQTAISTIHQQFEAIVQLYGDGIALVHSDVLVSYSELNERANQLARYLTSLGAGEGGYVTLLLDRSVELIVAILATLKTGATYIPLDTHYPQERIRYVLEDSKSMIMVTTEAYAGQETSESVEKQVVLDDPQMRKEIYSQPKSNLEVSVSSEDIAYVIYTSGSTGDPKGVEIPHQNVLRLIDSGNEIYAFKENDVWTLFHSPAFDFSVWEMYGSLLNGGKLVIVPYCVSRNPATFYHLLQEEKVTVLNQTPTAFHQLSNHMQGLVSKKELNIRYLIFGGEKLSTDLLEPWTEHYVGSSHKLFNMYGITETCVHVTYAELSADALSSRPKSWIGWPIPGANILVINDNGEIASPGDSGEIYVGGFGLASGYLGRSELTQKVFIPNTFSEDYGPRLYKTGDRARVLSDGSFEYLDRADRQVKLRGFRIELGEIESTLMKHSSVRLASALLRQGDLQEHNELAAFVCLNAEEQNKNSFKETKIKNWEGIYNQFAKCPTTNDPCLDFEGWNSSFTGKPISREEMNEWAEETVERINNLNPKNILEIGCGHGMFLFRLANIFENYTGVDISSESLDRVRERVSAYEGRIGSVSLHQGDALGFLSKGKPECDTIVINSVIQYFPGIDYLTSVLKSAVGLLEKGGSIIIGDVRDWRLLETFQSAIHLHRSDDACSARDLLKRIKHSVEIEEELLVAPEYFVSLSREMPEIDNVEILLKESEYENELNDFRYDVVLHVNKASAPSANVSWIEWDDSPGLLEAVGQQLKEEISHVGVKNAPNKRLSKHSYAYDLIRSECSGTKLDIEREVENKVNTSPELLQVDMLEKLAKSFSYSIERRCGVGHNRCDILLKRSGVKTGPVCITETGLTHFSGIGYSNDPLKYELRKSTISDLRQYLRERLPAHMVPSSIVIVDEMPITENGKVDESALIRMIPTLKAASTSLRGGLAMNSTQQKISEMWKHLLDISEVGLNDSFFDIGGHSLFLMNVISEIEEAFDVELSVEDVFSSPTLSSISKLIDNRSNKISS